MLIHHILKLVFKACILKKKNTDLVCCDSINNTPQISKHFPGVYGPPYSRSPSSGKTGYSLITIRTHDFQNN